MPCRCLRLLLALVVALLCLPSALTASATTGVREVSASERSIIPLETRVRYTTMIVLPQNEEIVDVVCGDRDFWVINAIHNIAYVKPAKKNAATDLDLVTSSGTIYSFLLSEKDGTDLPDLKVYVDADSDTPRGQPAYYTAAQYAALQASVTKAREAAEAEQRQAKQAIAEYRAAYPIRLRFDYGMPKYKKPFLVRAIWDDGRFTYIRTDATELPALYEVKDGKPSLVDFQVHGATYVVPKVIERGYLALGKDRFPFAQQEPGR